MFKRTSGEVTNQTKFKVINYRPTFTSDINVVGYVEAYNF